MFGPKLRYKIKGMFGEFLSNFAKHTEMLSATM